MAKDQFDPQPIDKGESAGRAVAIRSQPAEPQEEEFTLTDDHLLDLVGQAEDASRDDMARRLTRAVERAQRAWRNEHSQESKYNDKINYRGRSRLFVPKTRMGIRKNKAGAAAALFSTTDVISISAQFDDEPAQLASASVIQALVQYRLGGSGGKRAGVPWYQMALAARHDCDVQGMCISKQFWDYQETASGRIAHDRPMIELHPIENVYMDPAAPWYDPIGLGAFLVVGHPMHLCDIKAKMQSPTKDGTGAQWRVVPDSIFQKAYSDDQRSGPRRARDGGTDRTQPPVMPKDYSILWVNENFVRIEGEELHFWSLGRYAILSDPILVEEAYPEQRGDRPYIGGVAEIDPHITSPMPPVESWQPLQLEINDVTNLRLDTVKRGIAPFAKVRRGRRVDYEQLKRRGQPEAMIILDDPEKDVVFEKTPPAGGESYTETDRANAHFDELAGAFSTSSVQSNRALNDTVGGMKLMSGGANATSEYDLRNFVETWVERVLHQIIRLEQFFESDEKVLSVAGKKAKAFQKYGIDPTLDMLLDCEVTLRVNAGVGAQDPMQRIAKLRQANEILAPYLETMTKQGIEPNMEQMIEEAYGAAGYKDGHRFFKFNVEAPPAPPDPAVLKIEADKEISKNKIMADMKMKGADLQLEREKMANQNAISAQDRLAQGLAGSAEPPAEEAGPPMIDENGNEVQDIRNAANPPAEVQAVNPLVVLITHLVQSIQTLDANMQANQQATMQMQQATMQGFAQIVAGLQQQQGAPVQFTRGPDGLLNGMIRNGRQTTIVRDGNQNLLGAVPE